MNAEAILKLILRLLGGSSLFALVFVVLPYKWMDSIHASIGMGRLPDTPVVLYLIRTTSAFYAAAGALFWIVSFDLGQYRSILILVASSIGLLGLVLFWVDWSEGMPLLWKVWEGPFLIALGFAMLLLIRRLPHKTGR